MKIKEPFMSSLCPYEYLLILILIVELFMGVQQVSRYLIIHQTQHHIAN